MKIQNNRIFLDNKELKFKNKIIEAVEYRGKIVIVFDMNEDDGFDNVFCYTLEKQLLWKIKPVPIDIGGTARTPYVGVDVANNMCRVVDFFGRRFTIDIENGEIISKDIVR